MEDRECDSGERATACGSFVVIDGSFLVYGGFTGEKEYIFLYNFADLLPYRRRFRIK